MGDCGGFNVRVGRRAKTRGGKSSGRSKQLGASFVCSGEVKARVVSEVLESRQRARVTTSVLQRGEGGEVEQ